MTEDEKKNLADEGALIPPTPEKKPNLITGAKELLESTFGSLKGRDINQSVEEFTSEMTIVAEGLSEDMTALRRDADLLGAQLTLVEEDVSQAAKAQDVTALQNDLRALVKRVDALEKPAKPDKKDKRGLYALLRQATWMVGFVCIAWVIVTLLKLLGGA